jgi:hypothetical protein
MKSKIGEAKIIDCKLNLFFFLLSNELFLHFQSIAVCFYKIVDGIRKQRKKLHFLKRINHERKNKEKLIETFFLLDVIFTPNAFNLS